MMPFSYLNPKPEALNPEPQTLETGAEGFEVASSDGLSWA